MVSRLQTRASQIGNILASLEKKYDSKPDDLPSGSSGSNRLLLSSRPRSTIVAESSSKKTLKSDTGPPNKKLHYIDPIPPFNANKIRKLPTTAAEQDLPPSIDSVESRKVIASTSERIHEVVDGSNQHPN